MNDITKVGETLNANELANTEVLGKKFSIFGDLENPLFVAKDVADWIGLTNVTDMISRVDEEEVTKLNLGGLKGECNMLTENGLYEVLMQSRKPMAREFKKGVKKILHELRVNGEVRIKYAIPQTYSEALLLASNQAKQIEEQQKLIEVQTPKVEFFDAVADSKTAIQMNDVAKTLAIKGFGRNNLFEFLRSKNILMRNNQPYQKYVDCGYFRVIEQRYQKNNEECINFKTLVYQKGVDFIRKTILSNVSSIGKNNKELNN